MGRRLDMRHFIFYMRCHMATRSLAGMVFGIAMEGSDGAAGVRTRCFMISSDSSAS